MLSSPSLRHPPLPVDFEPKATLDGARALQRSAADSLARALRGKNLGLLCESAESAEAQLFQSAAQALGARVAHIRPSLSLLSKPQDLSHTARLLGRLYNAIECQGLAPELVQQIRSAANVPVYAGLAADTHPSAELAAQLEGSAPSDVKHRLIVQAVLLQALG